MVGALNGEAGHPPWEDIPTSTMDHSRLLSVDQLRRVASSALAISVDRHDGMRWVTIIGAAGLSAAVAMALLGLPPVDLHGPFHRIGIMDPFCGGTRAARLTARGDLAEAWTYNPLGIAATFTAAASVVRLSIGLLERRWINVAVAWTPLLSRSVLIVAILLLAALEVRQQGRADLLLGSS